MQATARLLAAAALLALFPVLAEGQAPKPGTYYVDSTDIGFKVKVPKGWEYIPPEPSEIDRIGVYVPDGPMKFVSLGGNGNMNIYCWLLKFDRRGQSAETDADSEKKDRGSGKKWKAAADIAEFISRTPRAGSQFELVEEPKVFKGVKVPATEYIFEGKSTGVFTSGKAGLPVYIWAVVYEMGPDLEVGLVFNAPAAKKKWAKWKKPLRSMAKSFKRVEVERVVVEVDESMSGMRAAKYAELQDQISRMPGWALYYTPNYFIISANSDRKFMQNIQERLEAIRAVYEAEYPIEKALEARRAKERREAEQAKRRKRKKKDKDGADEEPDAKSGDGEDDANGDDEHTVAMRADPMERSRTSIVRVCENRDQYHSYGGPGGSAGFWNSDTEELVIYDDKEIGGRENTWLVLNHEAFHQYIFYFYGNIAPHSWYNEGTGDFYSGYKLKHNKFDLKPAAWRQRTAQVNIRAGKYAPLKDLVRWKKSEYYGNNDLKLGQGANYAQGWALVYFLRTGKANRARGWQDSWGNILDVYLDTIVETGDLEEAVDEAFDGVDWEAFEEAWKNYTLKG